MRAAPVTIAFAVALAGTILSAPPPTAAQTHICAREPARRIAARPARHRRVARLGHAYHIPRFDQGEAEAFVHTAYPYRTGLYVPWPDAYGAPYPY